MSVLRPVSAQSIISIPWMSSKSLAHAMRDVSLRGPNSPETWTSLQSRGDMIAHSFSSKHSALMLSALARVRHLNPELVNSAFVSRFVNRILFPSVWNTCNSLDVSQILHAMISFPDFLLVLKETIKSDPSFLSDKIKEMDPNSLSMTSLALSKLSLSSLFVGDVLMRVNSIECTNDQLIGQVLQLVASNPGEAHLYVEELHTLCTPLADRLDQVSVRSLTLITSSLVKIAKHTHLDFLSEYTSMLVPLMDIPDKGASLKQLAVLLHAVYYLAKVVPPALVEAIRRKGVSDADGATIYLLASGYPDKQSLRDWAVCHQANIDSSLLDRISKRLL